MLTVETVTVSIGLIASSSHVTHVTSQLQGLASVKLSTYLDSHSHSSLTFIKLH